MEFFESLSYMAWRGLAIGIMISAPMGPVGILCIQRTLDKGRKAGFYTGVGAAISDLFYSLLTGFGLSFIEDFIERNQNIIQLFGSLVLIAFSVYLFRKDPSSTMRRSVPQNVSPHKNIIGGFLFTFSNPLILLLIIGLFARFNFLVPGMSWTYIMVGYITLFGGAILWWYGVTHAIERVRSKFNMRTMRLINTGIGIVILGFAVVGIIGAVIGLTSQDAHAQRLPASVPTAYAPCTYSLKNPADSTIEVNLPEHYANTPIPGKGTWTTDFKVSFPNWKPGKKVKIKCTGGNEKSVATPPLVFSCHGCRFEFEPIELDTDALNTVQTYRLTATMPGGAFYSTTLDRKGFGSPAIWHHFRFALTPDMNLSVMGGNKELHPIYNLRADIDAMPTVNEDAPASGFQLEPGIDVQIREFETDFSPAPGYLTPSIPVADHDARMLATADPLERAWRLCDYVLTASREEPDFSVGGNYEVMLIKVPGGDYEMIYRSGASINSSKWHKGMLKGILHPTGVSGVYTVTWVHPHGKISRGEWSAQTDNPLNPSRLTLLHNERSATLIFSPK